MKNIKFLIIVLIYLLILICIYIIHVNNFNVKVIFYSSLLDSVIAILFLIPVIKNRIFFDSVFNKFEKLQICVICLLIGYCFSISIPTVLDRSLSFYILQKIDQRGSIKVSDFESIFTQEYVKEHQLVDIRLTEQLVSGTIEISNDCVKLTERGKRLVIASLWFRKYLLAKNRLINDEYTNKLTLPFDNQLNTINNYLINCKNDP